MYCFVDVCLSFCLFSFGHCVVCHSSMYHLGIFKVSLSIRISLHMKGIIALIEHLLSNFVLCRDLCFTGVYLDQNVFTVCSISCRTGLEKIHLYLGIN